MGNLVDHHHHQHDPGSLTSLPLVSPLSNHSTVTLFVSTLMPDTTAEWIRPADREEVRKEARNEFYTASKPFTGMKIAEDLVIMMKVEGRTQLRRILQLRTERSLRTATILDIG